MPLVETGIMKDIKLGSTDVQLVLQGSTVVWERDRYPEVGWPEDYYMPYVPGYRTNQMIMFFLPSTGSTSVHFGAYASDCEGEGGDPNLARLVDDDSILAHDYFYHTDSHPLTASTGNLWVGIYENYELYFGNPGNIFSEYGSKGMIVSGGYRGTTGESCDSFFEMTTAITEHYPDIEFFGIIGEVGNSDTVNGNPHAPSWTSDQQGSDWLTFTSLKWFFTEDTHWEIPLYMSSAFTEDSMKFTIKHSPNATFIVDNNDYWQGIIDWDMADYYNVVFKTRDGQIIRPPEYKYKYLTVKTPYLEETEFLYLYCGTGTTIQFRSNGGSWQNVQLGNRFLELTSGESYTFEFRGTNDTIDFSVDGNGVAYGNVLSLFYGDDFEDKTGFPTTASTIEDLLHNRAYNSGLLTDVKNVILPSELTPHCFENLFKGNSHITSPPKITATALAPYCFKGMFAGCSSLTKAPNLPYTALTQSCYYEMFSGCTGLTTVQAVLPASALANHCYYKMFAGCSSLTTAPYLPATSLTRYCYYGMFSGCTNLTTVQQALPATTLDESCYECMYWGCASLTTAPELPATALTVSCYEEMFVDCTSLTRAPDLNSTKVVSYCYLRMFAGCTNLNYVKCMRSNTSTSGNACSYWLGGVSQTGTFVKNPNADNWSTGVSGIPDGWTVIDAT